MIPFWFYVYYINGLFCALVNGLPHITGWFELRHAAFWQLDFFSGFRISRQPGFPVNNAKTAQPADFDFMALTQRLVNHDDKAVDHSLRLYAPQPHRFGYFIDQVGFGNVHNQ